MPDRRHVHNGDQEEIGAATPLSGQRLDSLLNRLFTQELRQDEAEAILKELAPAADELVSPLVNLLSSPDPHTRETASQALIYLKHPAAAAHVRSLLERAGTSDVTRLAAYATLAVMGEAPDAETLLQALRDPERLFERSLDDLLASFEQDQSAWEFWQSLLEVEPEARREIVRNVADRRDARARKLLSSALWDEDSEVALIGVEGLRALGDPRAADSLAGVAEISRKAMVAEAARAAAVEIRVRSSARGEEPVPPTGEPECWASFIDGDGGQLLMAVRAAPAGLRFAVCGLRIGENRTIQSPELKNSNRGHAGSQRLRLASVFLSDHRGIVDASGTDFASAREAEEMRNPPTAGVPGGRAGVQPGERLEAGMSASSHRLPADVRGEEAAEIDWVRVDAGYCRAAIEAARQINRRDHRRLPGVWEFWRDTFEGASEDAEVALDDRSVPEQSLRRRLPQTATLIEFDVFRSWLIQMQDLAPFLPTALRGMARGPREQEEHLARAVSDCLAKVMKGRERRTWRGRLLRQAALWQRRGDRVVTELCLAAAWGLDDRRGVPSEEHPMLRAMVRASMELAMGL